MKYNLFLSIIALLISALLAFMASLLTVNSDYNWLVFVIMFLSMTATMVPLMGVKHEDSTISANLRVLSLIGVIAIIISQCLTNFIAMRQEYYVIISMVTVLVFLGVYYSISKVKLN